MQLKEDVWREENSFKESVFIFGMQKTDRRFVSGLDV